MSVLDRIFDGVKGTIELNAKVESSAKKLGELASEVRGIHDRLVRIETIIEITRPDGGILKLKPPS